MSMTSTITPKYRLRYKNGTYTLASYKNEYDIVDWFLNGSRIDGAVLEMFVDNGWKALANKNGPA